MSITFILAAVGFTITFALLFYFTAKYRESAADEGVFITEPPAAQTENDVKTPSSIAATIKRASMGGPYGELSLEIDDLKEKIRDIHYHNEELRLLSENRTTELLKAISKLETRLNAFEEEYVNKLQPTLMSLIEDLEKMKPSEE
ncbi:hypothetical protein Emin_0890 [Elusimicrobium minutum Pei191]|uniref:Uncharacterized protein n=1 Tax=Elusimicrobium minutum (strain Pei191) TaxID=445932 RepID=B2KD49_ELUMP|nr:hypothetical protein [Elusimicrobium minutum]ACC98445.1 hypothetical protein Emin_0890 [Elusimicrobium minutum Pei191]